MPDPTLADRVRAELEGRQVREVRMFGGLSFMVDGRMLVAVRGTDSLLVRIDPTRHEEVITQPGAAQAYMGAGRPMGPSWVTVDGTQLADDPTLRQWLALALEHHAAEA